MSQVCCVEDCNHSRSRNKCTLKRFPADSQKCKLWEDIVRKDGWERTSWDRICECHFSEEQFEQNRTDGLHKLRWDAIPTLFGSNLRKPFKALAEESADKGSISALDEIEDLEELEVEIEENSNSDEGSDVETYIITGDLEKTIQVIKEKPEKESSSSIRSAEKSALPTVKPKTKRILIKVPSSVGNQGDPSPAKSDKGEMKSVNESADSSSVTAVNQNEDASKATNLEEDGTTNKTLSIAEATENFASDRDTRKELEKEITVPENVAVECSSLENAVEGNAACVSLKTDSSSTEAGTTAIDILVTEESAEIHKIENPQTENLEKQNYDGEDVTTKRVEAKTASTGTDGEHSASGGNLPESSVSESTKEQIGERATAVSVGTDDSVSVKISNDSDEKMSDPSSSFPSTSANVSDEPETCLLKEPSLDTEDANVPVHKSDWKNPKLKARDAKIIAGAGGSRTLLKKRLQIAHSRQDGEGEVVKNVQLRQMNLEASLTTQTANQSQTDNPENLEVKSCESEEMSSKHCAEENVSTVNVPVEDDKAKPIEAVANEAVSVDEQLVLSDDPVETVPETHLTREDDSTFNPSKLDKTLESSLSAQPICEVSDDMPEQGQSSQNDREIAIDDAVIHIEERLEKIFADEKDPIEEKNAGTETALTRQVMTQPSLKVITDTPAQKKTMRKEGEGSKCQASEVKETTVQDQPIPASKQDTSSLQPTEKPDILKNAENTHSGESPVSSKITQDLVGLSLGDDSKSPASVQVQEVTSKEKDKRPAASPKTSNEKLAGNSRAVKKTSSKSPSLRHEGSTSKGTRDSKDVKNVYSCAPSPERPSECSSVQALVKGGAKKASETTKKAMVTSTSPTKLIKKSPRSEVSLQEPQVEAKNSSKPSKHISSESEKATKPVSTKQGHNIRPKEKSSSSENSATHGASSDKAASPRKRPQQTSPRQVKGLCDAKSREGDKVEGLRAESTSNAEQRNPDSKERVQTSTAEKQSQDSETSRGKKIVVEGRKSESLNKSPSKIKSSSEEALDKKQSKQARASTPNPPGNSTTGPNFVPESEVKNNNKAKDSKGKTEQQRKYFVRSSKRSLIATAPPRSKQIAAAAAAMAAAAASTGSEEEEPEVKAPAEGKRRRGRPRRTHNSESGNKETSTEKDDETVEETRAPRYSKRIPKPTEKLKNAQSGKSPTKALLEPAISEGEAVRRSMKRKLPSDDGEDYEDSSSKGVRSLRSVRRKVTRGPSSAEKQKKKPIVPDSTSTKKRASHKEEDDALAIAKAQSICRVCGTEQLILLNIFGQEGTQLRLEDKIHSHLPIKVKKTDKMPLGVCHSCVVTLIACDSLVDKCIQVDQRLQKLFRCSPEEVEEMSSESIEEMENDEPTDKSVKEKTLSSDGPPVVNVATKPTPKAPDAPDEEADPGTDLSRSASEDKAVSDVRQKNREETKKPDREQRAWRNSEEVARQPDAHRKSVVAKTVTQPARSLEPDEEQTLAAEEEPAAQAPHQVVPQPSTPSDPKGKRKEITPEMPQEIPLVVKEEILAAETDSDAVSPMKRFGNTYGAGRRSVTRANEASDMATQDRRSVIVIPPSGNLRSSVSNITDADAPQEEYILSMDEPPDENPKTVIDSILDDWDEDDQDRATTSATANRVLTIKSPAESGMIVSRLYNDDEDMLVDEEGEGDIIIQFQSEEVTEHNREESFWPAPDPAEEMILPDTDVQESLSWKCGDCGMRGKSVGTFMEHKKEHQRQERKFYCSLCDQSFLTVEMLALHKKDKHEDEEEDEEEKEEKCEEDRLSSDPKPRDADDKEGAFFSGGNCKLYKCAQCEKMFGAAWSWKKHMEAHELDNRLADKRVLKCDVCNRTFFDKGEFDDHKATHTKGETPFQCSICDSKFATWSVFLTHVHTHKSSRTICKKCGRDFGDIKTLREHTRDVHPTTSDKKFACHLCDKVCRKKIALTEHLRKHTGEMPFECEVCHKRFSRLANYRAHVAIHENLRRFACNICGKRFNRQSIQQRHMKTHTRDTIKTSHVCRVCGEAFNKVNDLLEHRLNHTRDDVERAYWMDMKLRGNFSDFTCKVCEVHFTTVEALLLHMHTHTDDERDIALKRKPKAYTCDICHRTLWSKRTFQTHKQWHTQKQFSCTLCDKRYATQTGLNYHMFVHTGERPFQCSFCDKCYKNKNDLRIHVRIHTGDYPYKCVFCPKAFRSPSSLIKHGDAHTEERPYKCGFCDQAFKRENTRANHERIHTNDKRFLCKYCSKGFIQKGACIKHEKWHETVKERYPDASEIPATEAASPDDPDDLNEDSEDFIEHEFQDSADSVDSYSMKVIDDIDHKVADVVGLTMAPEPSQPVVAEPVDEANAMAPSSADKNVHITLLG